MKKEFIKGQKAWSSRDGEVEISRIIEGAYCVRTEGTSYTACGRIYEHDKYPVLFYSKADMIEYFSNLKDKKYYTAWINLYPSGVVSHIYRSKENADRCCGVTRVECREITWVVEL